MVGDGGDAFAHLELVMCLTNDARVAAYKWQLQPSHISGFPSGRGEDFVWSALDFRIRDSSSSIPLDTTILPGGQRAETIQLGLWLRSIRTGRAPVRRETDALLRSTVLHYRIATEVGRSEETTASFGDALDAPALIEAIEANLP